LVLAAALLVGAAGATSAGLVAVLGVMAAVGAALAFRTRWAVIVPLVPIVAVSSRWGVPAAVWYGRFAVLGLLALMGMTTQIRDRHLGFSPLLPLVAVAAFSLPSASSRGLSAQRLVTLVLLAGALATLRTWWARDPRRLASDLRLVTAAGVVVAAGSLLLLVLTPRQANYGTRLAGLVWNPNSLGMICALTLPGCVALSLRSRSRWPWATASAVMAVALLLSGSRAGALAAIGGVGVVVLALGRRSRLFVVVCAFAAAATVVVFTTSPARTVGVNKRLLGPVGNASYRVSGASFAWQLGTQRPVIGHGFGSSDHLFGEQAHNKGAQVPGNGPHSGYLDALIDTGLLGLVVLAAVIVAVGRRAIDLVRADRDSAEVWILLGGLTAGLLESVAESGLLSVGSLLAYPFWLYAYAVVFMAQNHGHRLEAVTSAAALG
jgi:O-antigen ligase